MLFIHRLKLRVTTIYLLRLNEWTMMAWHSYATTGQKSSSFVLKILQIHMNLVYNVNHGSPRKIVNWIVFHENGVVFSTSILREFRCVLLNSLYLVCLSLMCAGWKYVHLPKCINRNNLTHTLFEMLITTFTWSALGYRVVLNDKCMRCQLTKVLYIYFFSRIIQLDKRLYLVRGSRAQTKHIHWPKYSSEIAELWDRKEKSKKRATVDISKGAAGKAVQKQWFGFSRVLSIYCVHKIMHTNWWQD